MQKKYAWTTLLTSEDYLQTVLNLQYSLRRVRSEYPLVIIVTDTIFMKVVSTLQANNCNFYVVPDLQRMHDNNDNDSTFRVNMLMKFYSFELTEYSKVCYIDGDSLFLKNCDFIFSYRAPAAKHLGWEHLPIQDTPHDKIGIFAGELMVLEPGTFSMEYFFSHPNIAGCWDEAILRDNFGPQRVAHLPITDTHYIYHAHTTGEKNRYWEYHNIYSEQALNNFLDSHSITSTCNMDWNRIREQRKAEEERLKELSVKQSEEKEDEQ